MENLPIKDLIINNDAIYLSRRLNISSSDIEERLHEINYTGEGLDKISKVENARLPRMIEAFYLLIFQRDAIPNQKEFVDFYLARFFNQDAEGYMTLKGPLQNKYSCPPVTRTEISTRLLRTYPSLIRDIHFYSLCLESGKFEKIRYSLSNDYEIGHDLMIWQNGQRIAVNLYINSQRAVKYREIKPNRHEENKIIKVDLAIERKEVRSVNNFYLYTQEHVKLLEEKINKVLKSQTKQG